LIRNEKTLFAQHFIIYDSRLGRPWSIVQINKENSVPGN